MLELQNQTEGGSVFDYWPLKSLFAVERDFYWKTMRRETLVRKSSDLRFTFEEKRRYIAGLDLKNHSYYEKLKIKSKIQCLI